MRRILCARGHRPCTCMWHVHVHVLGWVLALAAMLAAAASPARAQSLLERTDNLSGVWVGNSGQLYFNFIHRFIAGDAPTRKISNFPTFTVAAGLPARTLLGFNYATNSVLAPSYPNEWEFFLRNRPFSVADGAPLDLGAQIVYNLASDGVDGELSLSRELGPIRPILAARVLADPFEAGSTQFALGGGAVVRVFRFLHLSGDIVRLFEDIPDDSVPAPPEFAWSAGLRVALPYTPHTLSIHAANTTTGTLQGTSRGDVTRWGFEFTVPLTLGRWRAAMAPPEPPPAALAEARVDTVFVTDTVVRVDTVVVRDATPALVPAQAAPTDSAHAAHADSARAALSDSASVAQDSARAAAQRPAVRDTTRARPPAQPQRPAATVRPAEIRNLAFAPGRIEVARGTIIEWTNRDQVQHSVTARDGSFDSGLINPGGRFRRAFDRAGTYEIYCRPHPFMRMTVVVR